MLIPVKNADIGDSSQPAVNARELHQFLESVQHYSDWIRGRIETYGFIEDIDYCVINSEENRRIEYFVSMDMAKQLSMVERNDKGREARLYFIECEKIAKGPQILALARQKHIEDLMRRAEDGRRAEQELIQMGEVLDLPRLPQRPTKRLPIHHFTPSDKADTRTPVCIRSELLRHPAYKDNDWVLIDAPTSLYRHERDLIWNRLLRKGFIGMDGVPFPEHSPWLIVDKNDNLLYRLKSAVDALEMRLI